MLQFKIPYLPEVNLLVCLVKRIQHQQLVVGAEFSAIRSNAVNLGYFNISRGRGVGYLNLRFLRGGDKYPGFNSWICSRFIQGGWFSAGFISTGYLNSGGVKPNYIIAVSFLLNRGYITVSLFSYRDIKIWPRFFPFSANGTCLCVRTTFNPNNYY